MGITNNIPPSRLIQPGVCTSTTRPASPFEGQAIFETDTDRMLIWNGTVWVMPNKPSTNPDGLELIKAQTVGTGVSSVPVTDVFSATYDSYRVLIRGVKSSPAANVLLAFGSVVSGYYGSFYYDNYNGSSTGTLRRVNGANLVVGTCDISLSEYGASFDIHNPFISMVTSMTGSYYGYGESGWYGGTQAGSNSFTSFVISPNTGTITGGTITVYGYRK